jgi:hypothetical protein
MANDVATNEKIEIQLSKGKSFLILLGAIAFVVAGIWFVIMPPQGYNPIFIRLVGIAAILFFGFGIITAIRMILDKKAGLVIDSTGITDNASGISAGHIAWKNVVEIKSIKIKNQNILMIIVNNPAEYINRQQNPISRQMAEMNNKIYGSPISISSVALKCDFNKLNTILQEQLKRWK